MRQLLEPVQKAVRCGRLADVVVIGAFVVLVIVSLIFVGLFLAETGAVLSMGVLQVSTDYRF